LVGVSGLTVYHWEHGVNRPRNAQLAALVALRGIARREALKQLEDRGNSVDHITRRARRKPR
jgi:hypothetical protein